MFSPSKCPDCQWGQSSTGGPLEVQQLRREADHSATSGAEVKNGWSCTYSKPHSRQQASHVSFITVLDSNLCTALTAQKTTDNNLLSHTQL
jgi:hypothetical protein